MDDEIPELVLQLGSLLHHPLSSIEVVPGDGSEWFSSANPAPSRHKPFIFLERNLGVPQKVLYKAYLLAVPIFARCRRHIRSSSSGLDPALVQAAKQLSAVLLLANPAHQTALNARKRLVLAGHVNAQDEFDFSTALLSVRDAAKQSILWHHRRWLLHRVYPPRMSLTPEGPEEDYITTVLIPPNVFRKEFELVSRACETYPRNYHAWAHRHVCLATLIPCAASLAADSPYMYVLRTEHAVVRTWTERHVADYTAMQYICVLGQQLPVVECAISNLAKEETYKDTILDHASNLLKAYPNHEALWMYLRGALIKAGTVAPRDALEFARGCLESSNNRSSTRQVGHALFISDADGVHGHAIRFLAWWGRQTGITGVRDSAYVRRVVRAASGDRELSNALSESIIP